MTEELIKNLSNYSKRNKVYIDASEKCGCYFCLKIFKPKDIKEWTDKGETAICPFCSVDSVIGDSTSKIESEFLEQASKYWFY
jgi:hypothetical protein